MLRDYLMRVLTFGTFDVFHLGHLNILERAQSFGTELFVGVSSDNLNLLKKKRLPVYPQEDRLAIVGALKCVHNVFLEESLEQKRKYLLDYKANCLVMGDDWFGKFDEFKDICDVFYLPRTIGVSTTNVIAKIKKYE